MPNELSTEQLEAICTAEYLDGLTELEFDRIDELEYPEFCEATICYAEDAEGNEVSEEMLDHIYENHQGFIHKKVLEHLY